MNKDDLEYLKHRFNMDYPDKLIEIKDQKIYINGKQAHIDLDLEVDKLLNDEKFRKEIMNCMYKSIKKELKKEINDE
jgi:divalent metal cation (Fe/Co/Zn/Cd) transporter